MQGGLYSDGILPPHHQTTTTTYSRPLSLAVLPRDYLILRLAAVVDEFPVGPPVK